MLVTICLILSLVIFFGSLVIGAIYHKQKNKVWQMRAFMNFALVITFVAGFLLVVPVNLLTAVSAESFSGIRAILASIPTTLQMFSLDGDYFALQDVVEGQRIIGKIYLTYGVCLYILAPLLLVGAVLSFFRNFLGTLHLRSSNFKNVYLFSSLNENTLLLAESCIEREGGNRNKALIVFADIDNVDENASEEIFDRADELGALCLKQDIATLPADLSKKKSEVNFFLMKENDSENLAHAISIIEQYKACENMSVYAFCDSVEGELFLSSAVNADVKMHVQRVNVNQAAVYDYLYKNNLYPYIRTLSDGRKVFSVVVAGMGGMGTELVKALCWYGQIPDVDLEIHIYEKDPLAARKFAALCPDIMRTNHKRVDGDSQYDIYFHTSREGEGIDVDAIDFEESVKSLEAVSVAFVLLGEDEHNMNVAARLRTMMRQRFKEYDPIIETMIKNPAKMDLLVKHQMVNFKGAAYNIQFLANVSSMYSFKSVTNSELEADALERHLKWVDKADLEAKERAIRQFYQYEYFRKSSCSSAIRTRNRVDMNIPGTDKAPADRTDEERLAIQRVEHAAWNAYMRTEGYSYGPVRDDMGKNHPLIIPFDELPESEKLKDDD